MTDSTLTVGKKSKPRLWLILLGIICLPLAYCTIAKPPPKIPFPYPPGSPDSAQLDQEFWRIFQRQDVAAVVDSNCDADLAHSMDGVSDSAAQLAERRLNAPPPQMLQQSNAGSDTDRARDLICRFERLLAEHPKEQTAAVILSAMYMWRVQSGIHPPVTDLDLHEARHHATQSVNNGNDLAGGFEASPTWLLGFINDDMDYKEKAYQQLVHDTLKFPTFHGYIEGAVLSGMLNPEHPEPPFDYKWVAISFMENIETCLAGNKLRGVFKLPEGMAMNRFFMNSSALVSRLTGRGYCYNTDVAPFNIQGLFVTQGDAYLKAGNIGYARVAYQNALTAPNSENWRFANEVQMRLDDMDGMRKKFLEDSGKIGVSQEPTAMIFQAQWYCAACHEHPTNYVEQ
jgi:hypothetical protein